MPSAFVLMPFSNPQDSYYKPIFKPALERAGLSVSRVDDLDLPQSIVSDIRSSIEDATILLCEMSGRNPNVFYELGLAHAQGKSAILVSNAEGDIPFDLRDIRTIIYDYKVAGWEKALGVAITRAARKILEQIDDADQADIRSETTSHDRLRESLIRHPADTFWLGHNLCWSIALVEGAADKRQFEISASALAQTTYHLEQIVGDDGIEYRRLSSIVSFMKGLDDEFHREDRHRIVHQLREMVGRIGRDAEQVQEKYDPDLLN